MARIATRYSVTAHGIEQANFARKDRAVAEAGKFAEAAEAAGHAVTIEVVATKSGTVVHSITVAAPAVDFDALLAEVLQETAAAAAAPKGRRAALGQASATGWELLYDKPKQNCEVGRRYEGTKAFYALICKDHAHVHPVVRLTSERAIRSTGGWCPSC